MEKRITRRRFIGTGAMSAAGMALTMGSAASRAYAQERKVRIGVIGLGRGGGLLRTALHIPGVEVPALCDIDTDRLGAMQDHVEQTGRPRPEGYHRNEYAWEKMVERDDLDAVIIATPWDWHTPMAVYAMLHGKYAGIEVPCSITLKECWDLVDTSEATGVPCMMLENWSFRRDNLAVLNMIRQGLFGTMVHCHCAHSHDCIDHWFFDREGNMRWGGEFLVRYNRDQYPTHSLGPVLSWLDINRGDRFERITSTATGSFSINEYFVRKFGADHPNARRTYAQGDIVTSLVSTAKGRSVVINYDMQLPRPYDNRWLIQGTRGLYNEQRNAVYIVDRSPEYHQWEPFPPYQEQFDHAWWRTMMSEGSEAMGHGGTDYLELDLFLQAVRNRTQTPIDVYDSVTMSCVVPLSGESIARGGAPVEIPDFTRGRWQSATPVFGVVG